MRTSLFVCSALTAPLLLPDAVRFAPAADAAVTKTFTKTFTKTVTHSVTLESVLAEIEISGEDDESAVDVSIEWSRTLEFKQGHLPGQRGRPALQAAARLQVSRA